MKLQGKTALVTGASRGIGRAIALQLAQQGLERIVLVARDNERLQEVAQEISALGVIATPLALDLTENEQVSRAIIRVWQECQGIDILVNCAGIAHQTPFLRSQFSQVQAEISVNLMAMYTITRLIARRMAIRGQGAIVNVSSLMGKIAAPSFATYSATKFAILGFTEALRSELREYNIKVVALLPSLTDTDMVRGLQLFRWLQPMTSQEVAKALINGLNRDKNEIIVGWQSHLALWCQKFAPRLIAKIVDLASPWREVFS